MEPHEQPTVQLYLLKVACLFTLPFSIFRAFRRASRSNDAQQNTGSGLYLKHKAPPRTKPVKSLPTVARAWLIEPCMAEWPSGTPYPEPFSL
jgi:hypothetical protein